MMLPVSLRSVAFEKAGRSAEAAVERAKITQRTGLAKTSMTLKLAAKPSNVELRRSRTAWKPRR